MVAPELLPNGEASAYERSPPAPEFGLTCAMDAGLPLLVVVEQAEDVVLGEAVAAFEEVEFDGEGEAGDFSAELLDQLDGGFHGAAGGEQVVYEDDALAGCDGVEVNLKGIGTVLKVISDAGHGSGELARLAHGHKAGVEAVGQGGSEDEAAGLDAKDQVNVVRDIVRRQGVNELGEASLVLEQGGDVVEQDAGLGEVGYGADQLFQGLHIDGVGRLAFFGHASVRS